MPTTTTLTVGTIGAGSVAQAIAAHAVRAGHRVILSNSRGPESLAGLVEELGPNASAGTVAEAARADLVILAVRWEQVPEAVAEVDWDGRVVVDTTNHMDGEDSPERLAALLPGAHVVKAFNTLYARVTKLDPVRDGGRLIVFLAGDDGGAKATTAGFIDSLGFAPVDLGDARAQRLMQFDGGPLSALHAVKLEG
ncbi:MAG: NAD(P)-binding domain-containing protein [Solirubrobacteraceae bacterium]|nr:NAD(P)-binding domain-containing protein [Patulibacter sp.]